MSILLTLHADYITGTRNVYTCGFYPGQYERPGFYLKYGIYQQLCVLSSKNY